MVYRDRLTAVAIWSPTAGVATPAGAGWLDAVPEADVRLQPRPAQVQVAVTQADVLGDGTVFRDLKRRRLRFVEDPDLAGEHFDFAGRELRVHGLLGPALYDARHADHELRSQLLRDGHERVVLAHDDLRHAAAIADVDEGHATQIADPVHPSEQHHVCSYILGAQRAAGVGSSQITEQFSHRVQRSPFKVHSGSGFCVPGSTF